MRMSALGELNNPVACDVTCELNSKKITITVEVAN